MRVLVGLTMTTALLAACGGGGSDPVVVSTPVNPTPAPVVTDAPTTPDAPAPDAPTDPAPTPDPVASEPLNGPPELDNPLPTTDDDSDSGTLNADLVFGSVTAAAFDNDAGTLALQIPFDGDEQLLEYVADGALNGYSRFRIQDDPLDREFVAFAAESSDGSLQGIVVSDGGQFNRFFGGGAITQVSFTPVTSGLASYAGDYVGVTNLGPALVTGNGADLAIVPGSVSEVTGTVFMNADLSDGMVNGSVFNRVLDLGGTNVDLPDIFLTATEIGAGGQFTGIVEHGDLDQVGTYDGALGGVDGASIAGVVSLGEDFLEGATIGNVVTPIFDDFEGETEYGVFVHDRCPGNAACLDSN